MKKASRALARNALRAEAMLKQLGNAARLRLLCCLVEGDQPVSALIQASGLSQSAASQHLAKLRLAGLVSTERHGQSIHYRLASDEARALLQALYRIYCQP